MKFNISFEMNLHSIPKRTQAKLSAPAGPGGRHAQIVEIACALVAAGLNEEAVFQKLRPNYTSDVSDREIRSVINWAVRKSLKPYGKFLAFSRSPKKPDQFTAETCTERAETFLNGFSCDENDLWEASPWRPLEDWRLDALVFLAGMYSHEDQINIVTEYSECSGKANPKGYGQTLSRDLWMRKIRDNGVPQSQAGAWIRMNPTNSAGISDENITACRFALIEFDKIHLPLQLSLIVRLPLPINAILTSGGKSIHAWVRIDAANVETYRATVREMLLLLKPFGVDQSNKNASRLSRLVGARRVLGRSGEGSQRLLYLNPDNTGERSIL